MKTKRQLRSALVGEIAAATIADRAADVFHQRAIKAEDRIDELEAVCASLEAEVAKLRRERRPTVGCYQDWIFW